MKRLLTRGSLVLAAALAASTLTVAPSGAATAQQTCKTLTGSVTITPGLTTTPKAQKATASGKLGSCTPSAKTGGTGTLSATLKLPANSSCQGLVTGNQTIKLTATAKWKNGKSSVLSLTAKTGKGSLAAAETATITGKVTKNLFVNHTVTAQIKISPKSTEKCTNASPVRHLTFKQTKPFIIH